jgi:hypothetical protein
MYKDNYNYIKNSNREQPNNKNIAVKGLNNVNAQSVLTNVSVNTKLLTCCICCRPELCISCAVAAPEMNMDC